MKTTNKLAFTMLELLFVIVALGIITSLAIPRLERDHLQDAAVQILQDIRYTQHLALMDDKTDPSKNNWQKSLWQIRFSKFNNDTEWTYTIGANDDLGGNLDQDEAAIDPLNRKFMYGGDLTVENNESSRVFITKKFGIKDVAFSSTAIGATATAPTTSRHIGFDYMGRPHRKIFSATNDYHTVMQEDLNITFTMSDDQTFSIIVEEQTGHAYIVGQETR